MVATNLAINQELLEEAKKVGGKKTKKDTVNEALAEYIQKRKQKDVFELFGAVDYESSYDYKKERTKR